MISTRSSRAYTWLPALVLLGLYLFVVFQRAWVADDPYLTLRTVHNFVNGDGLVYNVGERAQSYTHPLWLFVLSLGYGLTREPFYTTLAISIAISLAAAVLLAVGLGLSQRGLLVAFLALTLSNAYIDYSTSGLENCLTHLLLIIFLIIFLRRRPSPRKLFWLSFVAGLAVFNRMDTGLLFLPALLYEFLRTPGPWGRRVLLGLAGMAPFILWELFSLVYYGFLVPNTAVAKLNTDATRPDLWRQGFVYLLNSVRYDPITLFVIGLGAAVGVAVGVGQRRWRVLMIVAGVLLYLVYLINIGGDFMSGRFLTGPLLAMVVVLALQDYRAFSSEAMAALLGLLVVIGFVSPLPTLRPPQWVDPGTEEPIDESLIAHERLFYLGNNLIFYTRARPMPGHGFRIDGVQRRLDNQALEIWRPVGMRGYYSGPDVHVLDYFGLIDPLIARLPPIYRLAWRVGHFERVIPEGYLDSLVAGENLISDPGVAEYYDHLVTVTRGPLWSRERWRDIWRFNTGAYDDLIDGDAYRFPNLVRVASADILAFRPHRSPWDDPAVTTFGADGLEIVLSDGLSHARELEITVNGGVRYRLNFLSGDEPRGSVSLEDTGERFAGQMVLLNARVPAAAARDGFDTVRVIPYVAFETNTLGHLHLFGPAEWPGCAAAGGCAIPLADPRAPGLLHEGWAAPEAWGVWSDGPESVMHLTLAQGDYRLTVRAFPFRQDDTCDQTLAVWLNGRLAGEQTFASCEESELTFDLSGAVDGVNGLRFFYGQTAAPGEVADSSDLRQLGVGFVELRLEPRE